MVNQHSDFERGILQEWGTIPQNVIEGADV
jgi:hypothetical protein